ncbi:unnamed protein product [Cylicocyclus nassatus]|uniref:Uncharacterized protein n=1 Tax=Cylicocyclus nassatus TaxID=53992 RepID=A0AA36GPF6_CYLNA|nr:unnamed protein product [Cylicocyclus nassatus]
MEREQSLDQRSTGEHVQGGWNRDGERKALETVVEEEEEKYDYDNVYCRDIVPCIEGLPWNAYPYQSLLWRLAQEICDVLDLLDNHHTTYNCTLEKRAMEYQIEQVQNPAFAIRDCHVNLQGTLSEKEESDEGVGRIVMTQNDNVISTLEGCGEVSFYGCGIRGDGYENFGGVRILCLFGKFDCNS